MGVFTFIIAIVLISTVGKILTDRAPRVQAPSKAPQLAPGDLDRINEAMDDLSGRLGRLEEERDFYKELLEAPERKRGLKAPDSDAS